MATKSNQKKFLASFFHHHHHHHRLDICFTLISEKITGIIIFFHSLHQPFEKEKIYEQLEIIEYFFE